MAALSSSDQQDQQQQQPDDTCLLALEDNVLLHIAVFLHGPCRRQLRGSCQRLRRLVNELVLGADGSCEVDPFEEALSLASFPNLRAVNLRSCSDSDSTATILESAPCHGRHLTSLSIHDSDMSELTHELSALSSLRHLTASDCSNAHSLADAAQAWPTLEQLVLSRCGKGESPLELLLEQLLASCPAVSDLRVLGSSCFALRQQWEQLAPAFARLKMLCWRDSQTFAGAAITSMHEAMPFAEWALQELDLSYTRVSDAAMRPVAQLSQLRRLGLRGTNVGDAGLELLTSLTALNALHVKHCHRVTVDGVRALTPLAPSLHELSLGYQHTLEANIVCQALADSLPHLQHLDLLSDELSNAGLEAIGRLKGLRALLLWQAAHVTAAGLEVLLSGVRLTRLTLYACDGAVSSRAAGVGAVGRTAAGQGAADDAGTAAGAGGAGAGAATHANAVVGGGSGGLSAVAAHSSLKELHLGALPDVACADLAALAQLPALQRLTLEDMLQVGPDLLRELLACGTALKDVCVCGCAGLPPEALAQLLKQPRSGARLGSGSGGRNSREAKNRSAPAKGAMVDLVGGGAADRGAGTRRGSAAQQDKDEHKERKGRDNRRTTGNERQSGRKGFDRNSGTAGRSGADGDTGNSCNAQSTGRLDRKGKSGAAQGPSPRLHCPAARLWVLPVADPVSDEEGEEWLERRRRSPMYERVLLDVA